MILNRFCRDGATVFGGVHRQGAFAYRQSAALRSPACDWWPYSWSEGGSRTELWMEPSNVAIIQLDVANFWSSELEVSVRELKDHLSEYLRRAAAGEEIVVTSHARPVARLSGLSERAMPTAALELQRLRAQPWIRPGSGRAPRLPRLVTQRLPGEKSLSDMIAEDRE